MASPRMVSSASLLFLLTYFAKSVVASPSQPLDPRAPQSSAANPSTNTLNNNGGLKGNPWHFETVGNSGVSAQMMFLGTSNKVYILDKTENNPVTVTSASGVTHAAWASEYDINTNTYRTMDVESNAFCAGGGVLGNGTWAVFGGNQPVTSGGVAVEGQGVYHDSDGGTAIRLLDPCDDQSCSYDQGNQAFNVNDNNRNTGGYLQMTGRRWYPTVESLEDGTLIVIGGDLNGGYVNSIYQDNPTYEFFPKHADDPQPLSFLSETLPVNLYPLTWLMPDGRLFMQAERKTILYDYTTKTRTDLAAMPYSVRVYPGSAATAMLPLTAANNYQPTILFCGGSNPPQWGSDGGPGFNITAVPADNSCVRISPMDANPTYQDDDFLREGRSMGQFVYLPDGKIWMGNGVAMGTAGYGNEKYSAGESYGQAPIYQPALYDPNQPKGARWNFSLPAATEERMYHSTAVCLPDGAILISGSNPNADYSTIQWGTKYSVDKWYPSWYNSPRPDNSALPSTLSYGGSYWNIPLGTTDESIVKSAKVTVLRTGFCTHAMNMGQRYLELTTSYKIDPNTNTTTLYVSQMPANAAIFQPGPAFIHLVLNGIPSIGKPVMIGSGNVGSQSIRSAQSMPSPTMLAVITPSSTTSTSMKTTSTAVPAESKSSGAAITAAPSIAVAIIVLIGISSSFLVI